MEFLADAVGAFIHIRVAWDGVHIDVNLILLLMCGVVYTYWSFCRWLAMDASDFYKPPTGHDWHGHTRPIDRHNEGEDRLTDSGGW